MKTLKSETQYYQHPHTKEPMQPMAFELSDLCNIAELHPQEEKIAIMALLEKRIPEEGMLHPLLIKEKTNSMWNHLKHKISEHAKYVIWYGNNRYRYALKHGYTHIDCIIVPSGTKDSLCEQMQIPTSTNRVNENIWLEEGKKLLNFC